MKTSRKTRKSGSHTVQFYRSDAFLADTVAKFAGEGLVARQPVLLIATPEHQRLFTHALSSLAFDLNRAAATGQLTMLDAREVLATFMEDGMPDSRRFIHSIGGTIESIRAARPGATIRAFGEMVDLLLADGNPKAAVALERLWNRLFQSYDFSLLCAYDTSRFGGESQLPSFKSICAEHTHIHEVERPGPRTTEDRQWGNVSFLQQRARAMEYEIEYCKELGDALRAKLAAAERSR